MPGTRCTCCPFEYTNEKNEFVGIDVDILAAVAVSEASVAGAAASVVVDAALSVVVVSLEELPHPVAIVATIVAARIKLITFFFISEKPPFLYS